MTPTTGGKWKESLLSCSASKIWIVTAFLKSFPGGSDSKESVCSVGDPGLIPGLGRSPGKGNGKPTPVFLPGKSHGWRRLACYHPWGCKESDTTEWLHFLSFYRLVGAIIGNNICTELQCLAFGKSSINIYPNSLLSVSFLTYDMLTK